MAEIKKDAIWHDFFYVEMTTGLRRGEIRGLKWSDFDEASSTLSICRTLHRENGKPEIGDTKTTKGRRRIVLPPSTAQVLLERKKSSRSEWIFPDPLKPELPVNPSTAYRHMKVILQRAGLPDIRFHDLRHTFATTALEHGMDVKTLSAVIGHVSAATTLDIYAHITDTMQRDAAITIDRGIGKAEPAQKTKFEQKTLQERSFQPYKGTRRKPGMGCISQINETLWEGRYSPRWPDGKKHPRNIYAHTREECERQLAEMICEINAEIAVEKAKKAGRLNAE